MLMLAFTYQVRTALATYLHNLEILRVHPDLSFKISLALFLVLRLHVKLVGVQVVDMLLPGVSQVVLCQVFAAQHERHENANIFHVVRGQLDPAQGRLRREPNFFLSAALVVVGNIGHLVKRSRRLLAAQSLDHHILRVDVVKARFLSGRLSCPKFLIHLPYAHRFQRGGIQWAIAHVAICLSP